MQVQKKLRQKQFIKMHGAGNCFILIEHYDHSDQQYKNLAKRLCHPKLGIGADGLLVILSTSQGQQNRYYMKVFNSDGSYPQMCGNGLRCFCACLRQLEMQKNDQFQVKTDAGVKYVKVTKNDKNYNVKAVLGEYNPNKKIKKMQTQINIILPNFISNVSQLLTFNVQHLVIYLTQIPNQQQIKQYGKQLQKHINANINFATLTKSQNNQIFVQLQTFQRGCGLTLACGTGACATYVVGLGNKLFQGPTNIITKGGILKISIENQKVVMDGPAQFICRGTFV